MLVFGRLHGSGHNKSSCWCTAILRPSMASLLLLPPPSTQQTFILHHMPDITHDKNQALIHRHTACGLGTSSWVSSSQVRQLCGLFPSFSLQMTLFISQWRNHTGRLEYLEGGNWKVQRTGSTPVWAQELQASTQ